MNNYSSKLIEEAVAEISRLPGIGKRTALRLALHLLNQDVEDVETLGNILIKMRKEIRFCKECHNISDTEICEICSNSKRNNKILCVVEDIRDVIAIENTDQFTGLYHVLGGIISPIDGITPSDLHIESLENKVKEKRFEEIILALPTTIEGDTTNFYLYKRLKEGGAKISIIARGIAIGDDLEFTDEVTLGRSILDRTPYEQTLNKKNRQ